MTAASSAPDFAIDVRGLNKSFGDKHVVKDFSIQAPRGRITGFLGPNGSSKTTTLRMLCGLLTPDSGTGKCLGLDIVKQSDAIKQRIGYMTQKFSLYDDLTIEENLMFMARVHGLDQRQQRVKDALDRLGLHERRKQLAGKLSGGWKQRMALAATTLHEPELLLLDEPTAGVDPLARRQFWDEIHALSAQGLTVLVSTHYMDEAERCHDIAYIAYGRLMARGTATEILQHVGIVTWEGEGPGIDRLSQEIAKLPGVEAAAPFGITLHVSGANHAALEKALAPYQHPPFVWKRTQPTLEDAFIHLMGKSEDNFR
jgi:ABC-2 type transport system ATP-binding protein